MLFLIRCRKFAYLRVLLYNMCCFNPMLEVCIFWALKEKEIEDSNSHPHTRMSLCRALSLQPSRGRSTTARGSREAGQATRARSSNGSSLACEPRAPRATPPPPRNPILQPLCGLLWPLEAIFGAQAAQEGGGYANRPYFGLCFLSACYIRSSWVLLRPRPGSSWVLLKPGCTPGISWLPLAPPGSPSSSWFFLAPPGL